MYTKSDSAIQLGCFLVDFLWMRCEQDLCGSSFLEQADVDPGEIGSGGGHTLDWLQLNLSVSKFFIKRDETREEESILTTARVLVSASLQQWQVEQTVVHFSSIQVSRNGPFHNHKFHWARLFTRWNSDANDLYTWQLMLCEPKWTFSMCVFQRLYCGKLLYWFKGGPMIPWPVRYFPVEAVHCLWNQGSCTDKSWTCVFGSTLDAPGQSQRVFPEALQGRRCLQARRLRTRCRGLVLDPQELRHQGVAGAIWRISSCHTVTQQTRSNPPAAAPGRFWQDALDLTQSGEVAKCTATSIIRLK